MNTIPKATDLYINLLYSENLVNLLKALFGIDTIGLRFDKSPYFLNKTDSIVQRGEHGYHKTSKTAESKNKNLFLVGSIFKGNIDENFNNVDILTIKTLSNIKPLLKKHNGKNIGIEFLISDLKHCDTNELGKWFYSVKWVYEMCKKYKFQFILSSGANVYCELIPYKVFNVLLKKSDIDNGEYWKDLCVWLDDKRGWHNL
jgi:hypothetical protein